MLFVDYVFLFEVLNFVVWDYLGLNMIFNVIDVFGEIFWEGLSDFRLFCGVFIIFD